MKKKDKDIVEYNKEHCLPRFFIRKSNYGYDNNVLLQLPVDKEVNEHRAHKPYFCPFETET